MKKTSLLLSASLLCLVACANKPEENTATEVKQEQSQQQTQTMTYKDYVAPLTTIDFTELTVKMQNGEHFFLFLGRESCQYCNIFVPKLYQALDENPVPVYYYDTEDRNDQELNAFREKFGIQTVPNLSYYQGDQLVTTLEKGSQTPLEEIQSFLEQPTT